MQFVWGLLILIFYLLSFIFYPPVLATEANPPQTSLSISPSSQKGQNDWYVTGVEVILNSQDDSGVKIISYYLNGPPITDRQVGGSPQESTQTTLTQNGEHTFYYYATDIYGNVEETKSQNLKIDTVSPKNWREFTTTRTLNDHTFIFTIKVDDQTSGLDPVTAQFQYQTKKFEDEWGYFSDTTACRTNEWVKDGWHSASFSPATPGTKTGTLTTTDVDVCDSNWQETKKIRFKIKDIAGNESTAEFAVNSPWMKTSGGDVHANDKIQMTTTGPQPNATGVVSAVNSISGFSSSNGWLVTPYSNITRSLYQDFSQKLNPTTPLPDGKLPQNSGVGAYKVSGDFTVDEVTKPSAVANFTAIVFIDGTLYINKSFSISSASSLVFIVKDDVLVDKKVSEMAGFYLVDDEFNSSYNGDEKMTLKIYGGLVAGSFTFPRSLSKTDNTQYPAEEIIYQLSYLVNSDLVQLFSGSARYTWQEVAP